MKERSVKEIFAERLKYLLDDRGLNIKTFSMEIGIPDSTISDWLLLKRTPKIDNIPKIAVYFKISTDYLLGVTEYEN